MGNGALAIGPKLPRPSSTLPEPTFPSEQLSGLERLPVVIGATKDDADRVMEMRRRDFVAGLMIASAMRRAVAQQPAKTKRIAVVSPAMKVADMRADKNPIYRIFFDELNRLGYIEGQNLVIERYSAEGARERHAELAREVVGTRCAYRKSNPAILMMQSAQDRTADNASGCLDGT
jgi:hypothetical protein